MICTEIMKTVFFPTSCNGELCLSREQTERVYEVEIGFSLCTESIVHNFKTEATAQVKRKGYLELVCEHNRARFEPMTELCEDFNAEANPRSL